MNAILKKEMKNYFLTPIGYIFVSVFMAVAALFFVVGIISYQTADISYVLGPINIICLFIVPVLTMQLFSEERNKKTDQLLITAPINVSSIVMGKYFAALCVFLLTLAISLVYPIIMFIIGKPVLSEMMGSYIGFILIWAVFIAIGIFISSLTESQVVSAILTFIVLFILYSFDGWTQNVTNEWIKSALKWFSVFDRYSDFQSGILNLSSIVYYISFVFVFLFLTVRNIERRRYS